MSEDLRTSQSFPRELVMRSSPQIPAFGKTLKNTQLDMKDLNIKISLLQQVSVCVQNTYGRKKWRSFLEYWIDQTRANVERFQQKLMESRRSFTPWFPSSANSSIVFENQTTLQRNHASLPWEFFTMQCLAFRRVFQNIWFLIVDCTGRCTRLWRRVWQ